MTSSYLLLRLRHQVPKIIQGSLHCEPRTRLHMRIVRVELLELRHSLQVDISLKTVKRSVAELG